MSEQAPSPEQGEFLPHCTVCCAALEVDGTGKCYCNFEDKTDILYNSGPRQTYGPPLKTRRVNLKLPQENTEF